MTTQQPSLNARSDSWSTISNRSPAVFGPSKAAIALSIHSSHSHRSRHEEEKCEKPNARMQQHLSALELDDDTTNSSGSKSWMRRIAWFRSKSRRKAATVSPDSLEYRDGEAVYYGGALETDSQSQSTSSVAQDQPPPEPAHAFVPEQAPTQAPAPTRAPPAPLAKTSSIERLASWISRSSHNTHIIDEDSLADFQETEWTPVDSSYGAAIPVGGWIPKNVRRLIEWTAIALLIIALFYLIVATSIRLSDDNSNVGNSTSSGGGKDNGGIYLDDDRYIEYRANDDADDYFDATNDDAYNRYINDDDAAAAAQGDDNSGYNNNDADDGGNNNYANGAAGYNGYYGYNNVDDDGGGRRLLL